MKRFLPFTKNFYFLFGSLFLIWMMFVDSNDFYTQYKQRQKLKALEKERDYYRTKIQEVKKDREELLTNKDLLEKFAREKYLMKKKSEDVYVIEEEEK
ncbi:septum formation initiator family protein [Cytophagales bacterium RKSG123]|nr:septum formation initiator family protein [Xanthovirga aplysinae]MTI31469.1 septum formation initiator family protein [Xanthovirga aplysinae]